jgi:cytochrome c peroxidase
MKRPARPAFEEEPSAAFKTPSLLFVGGSEPFFHDGGSSTLEDLVDTNGDRMGKTSQLSAADRAALVAYLRRL